ncbi:hypothetical protein OG264_39305 (plasmid) [Streptomyces xanthophaeus]|uniref:hypothetical protein n=1 Tax=Streptomyces xanthophaeus TaxID=67385 RepID=UPI00386ED37A|nr:hypothetical protein OG264_39305 [Streptomyces xanthophaeus]WST65929.1 hypothetical protein OG605_40525 [Streptomyces xanthophaeus]
MNVRPCLRNHVQEIFAASGSVLCTPCLRQVERNLRTLPSLHQECLHHVSPTSRRTNPTKVSGSRSRDHLNISALDARHNSLAILDSWSGIITEKRGSVPPGRSALQFAGFLMENLDWITSQHLAADFADEIETITTELRRMVDPDPNGLHAVIRKCVVDSCAGTITAAPKRAGHSGRSSITCTSGHSWEMREWLTLRQLMERQRKSVDA